MASKIRSLTIFFPCYNDKGSIGKLIKAAEKVAKGLTKNYEIIVVDDYSTDGSRNILRNLVKKNRHLKLIFHEKNLGYGGALRSGFANASKEFIFYTDGDGQYDINELPILANLMTADVNFINGIKMTRHDPNFRILIGNLYSFFARWVFWLPVYDVDCDFRLTRKSLIERINLKKNSGSICIELVKKAQRSGAKFRQVSVHHYERRWGESQFFQTKRILSTLFEVMTLWLDLMVRQKFFKN